MIVNWNMTVGFTLSGFEDVFTVTANSTVNGDIVNSYYYQPGFSVPTPVNVIGTSTAPGTWTCQIKLIQVF
jgi:hypothetical protein